MITHDGEVSTVDLTELLTLADVERAARQQLDDATWAYVSGGAGDDRTVRANVSAYDSVWLRPRVLGTPQVVPYTGVTLFGELLSIPILLAPTSPQRLLHEDAELASASTAAAGETVSIVSTDSHYDLHSIVEAGQGRCWFQLYPYRSRADVEATIELAEDAGAKALVVTVDAAHAAQRVGARRAGFRTPAHVDFGILRHLGILNGDIPAGARLDRLPLTWDDLDWIRAHTELPLVVKGVLHPDDARRCVDAGADGVIVSNHGGRQLDGAVPSLVALEHVAAAVNDRCAVLVDGGIRSGVDVVKALALGAHAACIGRPYLWGLGLAGAPGVETVLVLLQLELEDALLQLGVDDVADIGRDTVASIRWAA